VARSTVRALCLPYPTRYTLHRVHGMTAAFSCLDHLTACTSSCLGWTRCCCWSSTAATAGNDDDDDDVDGGNGRLVARIYEREPLLPPIEEVDIDRATIPQWPSPLPHSDDDLDDGDDESSRYPHLLPKHTLSRWQLFESWFWRSIAGRSRQRRRRSVHLDVHGATPPNNPWMNHTHIGQEEHLAFSDDVVPPSDTTLRSSKVWQSSSRMSRTDSQHSLPPYTLPTTSHHHDPGDDNEDWGPLQSSSS